MIDTTELTRAIEAGDRATAKAVTQAAIDAGMDPRSILRAMTAAMDIVGGRFTHGEIYVPEMLIAARAMKEATALLEPVLVEAGIRPEFTAVIGTVKGDLHDIGKNLVGMMLKGAAIEVIDLGTNVPAERFVDAARKHQARIVAASALLTTTMCEMASVVAAVHTSGLEGVRVVVGGAPITAEYAASIGADGFAPDAASAVQVVQGLVRPTEAGVSPDGTSG